MQLDAFKIFMRAVSGIASRAGRCVQYLGGLCLLAPILRTYRERSAQAVSPEAFGKPGELHSAIFDNNPAGILLAVHDGTILCANPSACTMLGYDPAHLRRLAVGDLFDPDAPEMPAFRKRLTDHSQARADLSLVRRNGSPLPVEISSVLFRDSRNKQLEILTFKAIGERKLAEQARQDAYQRLCATIDSITDAYFAMDCNGKLLEINTGASQRLFDERDLVGHNLWEAYPAGILSGFYEKQRRAIASGLAVHFESYSKAVDRWFEVHACPRGGRLDVHLREITGRKRAEEALRKSESLFRMVVEHSRDGIVQLDLRTDLYFFVSPAIERMTGFAKEELMMTLEQAAARLHPDDYDHVFSYMDRIVAGDTPGAPVEYRWRLKSGEYRWFSDSRQAIFDETGQAAALVGVIRDITDLKHIQFELEKSKGQLEEKVADRTAELKLRNRQLQELARQTLAAIENDRRTIAKELHDSIGGTLAAIKHLLEGRIEAMSQPPPSVSMSFEKLTEHLVAAIQETRRITRQLRPAALDDFGLASAIMEYIKGFTEFYPGIDCHHEIRIEGIAIAEEARTVLYRVFQESMNNVGKHSRASRIHISLRPCGRHVCLEIRDNGRGFDVRSVMAGASLDGYGLHSMKERVGICRGVFRIDSAPDRGTRVEVKIPLILQEEAARARTSAADHHHPNS